PRVGHHRAAGVALGAPRIGGSRGASARRVLRLGFGRQALTGPRRVRNGVGVRDLDDRVIADAVDAAGWASRVLPVGAGNPTPPLAPVAQVDRTAGRGEHE